jgi:hypothetical protein
LAQVLVSVDSDRGRGTSGSVKSFCASFNLHMKTTFASTADSSHRPEKGISPDLRRRLSSRQAKTKRCRHISGTVSFSFSKKDAATDEGHAVQT